MAAGGSSAKQRPITEEKKNFIRFNALTMDAGTEAVRKHFETLVPPSTLSGHLKTHETKLKSLLKKKVLKQAQWDKLYPTTSAATNSSDFDMTILVCLIRSTTNETPPNKGWDNLPDAINISTGDDIARLKYYRNVCLAHNPVFELSTLDFNQASKDVIKAIDRLSGGNLTTQAKALRDLVIIDDTYPDLLRKFMKDQLYITDQQHVIVDKWQEENTCFIETNASNYVHKMLQKHQVVTISGYPGSGKSFMARHIALELQSSGWIIAPLVSIDQIINVPKHPNLPYIYVLDDPVGTDCVESAKLSNAECCNDHLLNLLKNSNIKIVFTCENK